MNKFTKLEKSWIMYDMGNSAFILLVSTLLPIYFNALAEGAGLTDVQYLAYWGYAMSASTLTVALLAPTLGSIADGKGLKKKLFFTTVLIGATSCALLGSTSSWLIFLIIFVIGKVAFSSCNVFYDAMLTDVTSEENVDRVSSFGYAWGYIGSCIPFAVCLVLVLMGSSFGISTSKGMVISFLIIASWWILLALPLLKNYKQVHYVEYQKGFVKDTFKRLFNTLKEIYHNKKVFYFLLAFFFYIDGVYTIIEMATAYGKALGLDTTGLLLALLVTQIVAFPCSLVFGKLSKKYDNKALITVCIIAYTCIAVYGLFLKTQAQFWFLAFVVGMFQGGIQALSRSYFTKIIPAKRSGEYFGLLDICGKGASFLGTMIISISTQLFNSVNAGIGMLTVIFVLGLILFRKSCQMEA